MTPESRHPEARRYLNQVRHASISQPLSGYWNLQSTSMARSCASAWIASCRLHRRAQVIRGHQRSTEVISGSQAHSPGSSGHSWPSVGPSGALTWIVVSVTKASLDVRGGCGRVGTDEFETQLARRPRRLAEYISNRRRGAKVASCAPRGWWPLCCRPRLAASFRPQRATRFEVPAGASILNSRARPHLAAARTPLEAPRQRPPYMPRRAGRIREGGAQSVQVP